MDYPERVDGEAAAYERWSPGQHAAAFADLSDDPEVMRFLGGPQSRAAADEVSARIADHWATFGFGLWAVVSDRECVGFAGACHPGPGSWEPDMAAEIEVGWRLARHAWGRGLATEGGVLALAAVRDRARTGRVIALVDPANGRSLAVAGRLGMRRAETVRNRRLDAVVDVYEAAA